MFYPTHLRRFLTCVLIMFAAVFSQAVVFAQVRVVTQHNDIARTGANLSETILNTSNVNTVQFGKLFSRTVTGFIYAQPLYLPGITINGAIHNVVYVGTMNNDLYAFDADDPNQAAPLWHLNFGPSRTANLFMGDFPGQQIGVLSTPVIDPATNTLYVVSNTSAGISTFQLHALDAGTGQEKFGGPTTIALSYPGTGSSSTNGIVTLNTPTHIQRPGLLLNGGRVYLAFSSTQDMSPYHGWIAAYVAADLTQPPLVYNDTPNGDMGGIWQGANGLTADLSGNIYAISGNGSFDTGTGPNHGNSMIKLDSTLHLLDWFTPYNSAAMNASDLDLGSSGLMGIPGTNYFIGGGKTSVLYLVNAANMGRYNAATDGVVQKVPLNAAHLHGGPIYWNSPAHGPTIYTWAEQDYLKAFSFANGLVVPTPISQSSFKAPLAPGDIYSAMPGGILSLSANGSQAGTGIVWACIPTVTGHGTLPAVLRAFDADNLTRELWDSGQNPARDGYGFFGKFTPPTIANGKVYVATSSGSLAVYGLLPSAPPPISGGSLAGTVTVTSPTVNLTAGGTSDWAHWGLNGPVSYIHKVSGGGQISDKTTLGNGATSYTNDPVAYSWSDGTPTTAANTRSGVYIKGGGNGFGFTVPADTTSRTLTVYVEAYQAQGLLTASLSDGSAAVFSDSSLSMPGGTNTGAARTYTLTYSAASAGQHLTVNWTLAMDNGGGNGNVAIQSATLTSSASVPPPPVAPPAAPTGLTAVPGNGAAGLGWGAVTGAGSYSLYRGTVSGGETLLKAGLTAVSYADTGLTNGATYFYQVSATGAGGESVKSAEVKAVPSAPVTPPAGVGVLSGAVSASASTNLTAEGTSDWAHWGLNGANDYVHKVSGGGQISDKRTLGNGATAYADNPFGYSWSDGTPTMSAANTRSGVYIKGLGNGYQLTVPADTTVRTLRVYVGLWRARGQLTATLSDGSAAVFSDSSVVDTSGPAGGVPRVYTLTYSAASAGQHLTVSWTLVADNGSGNVNLQAATLTSSASVTPPPVAPPAAPTGLTAAPANGAAGLGWGAVTGAGSYSLYRGTVSGGETLLKAGLTAVSYADTGLTNGTTYFYQVSATGAGGESVKSAEVKAVPSAPVTPPAGVGVLSGAVSASASTNLTAEGTSDWAHWGLNGINSFDHKASGGGQISDKIMLAGGPSTYADNPSRFSWSDGTPTASVSGTGTGVYVAGRGNGFGFTVPADTTVRTLRVYVGLWRARGQLTATLSDGSAAVFSDSSVVDTSGPAGGVPRVYTLTYSAGSVGQHLTVTWTLVADNGAGNINMQAATLVRSP